MSVLTSIRLPEDGTGTATTVSCCVNSNLGSDDPLNTHLLAVGRMRCVAGLSKNDLSQLFVDGLSAGNADGEVELRTTRNGWIRVAGGFVNARDRRLLNGRLLKCDHVPKALLEMQRTKFFYACCSCGHVYWDGSHYERVMQGIVTVVSARLGR
jgi:hypothetical protein